jgi:hypothetical protein
MREKMAAVWSGNKRKFVVSDTNNDVSDASEDLDDTSHAYQVYITLYKSLS